MPNPLAYLDRRQFDDHKARHLLSRAGFGGTPRQVRALAAMGLEGAIAHLVDYETVPATAIAADEFDQDIMAPRTAEDQRAVRRARQSGDEKALEALRRDRQDRQRRDRRQMASFQRWWLTRMIETPRPLEEKLTLFWHGHFATGYRTIEDSYHMFQQNQLFRHHAVGKFGALTHGIIHDPAMLRYLNNNQNRRQRPNENLARELMELFTLGEGNGYSERDIKEGARALTGYAYFDDSFVFRPRLHDAGQKTILGKTGAWDGDDFVDIILRQPSTSEFITLKLYKFFVNDLADGLDRPTRAYLRALSEKFRKSDYDVRELLRTMFMTEHFYADANIASKVKSPTQLIVQTIRSLHTPVRSLSTLVGAAALMGQNLGYPPSVKGWEGGRTWINTSTLFVRQNLMIYLLTGRRPREYAWDADGTPYDATALVTDVLEASPSPEEVIDYLLRFTLGRPPHPARIAALKTFVDDCGGQVEHNNVLIGMLSLIAAMPEYQLC